MTSKTDSKEEVSLPLPEDRLEGRDSVEGRLASWFEQSEWPLRLKQMKGKGYGMVSSEDIEQGQVVMSCPPYIFVPYETRKNNVCAYCFKMFAPDPEGIDKSQDMASSKQSEKKDNSSINSTENETKIPEKNVTENSEKKEDTPKIEGEKPISEKKEDTPKIEGEKTTSEKKDDTPKIEGEKTTSEKKNEDSDLIKNTPLNEKQNSSGEGQVPVKIQEVEFFKPENPRPCPFCEELWYCCQVCQNSDLEEHSNYECQALQNLDVKWVKDFYQYCDDLITDVRLLIRALNKRQMSIDTQTDPSEIDDFSEQYGHLISNKECYGPDVLSSLRGVVQIVNYLMPDDAQMEEDELLDLYCKHRVNMFGVWGDAGECLGYGVYPRASFFNHSCWPNVTFYKNKTSRSPFLDFVTVYSIPRGTEVCISYIDISEGLKPRRYTLKDKYFFHCECDRCTFQALNPNATDPYYDPQYYTDDTETTEEDTENKGIKVD
eukprot:TRINITY_DN3459_c0_g1_i1.p1 TRINITY_DN3459_c0_g1~~TRINITY_DN3459_c0_g1_i1.p1  ORF type:complete len:488 (+),score=85.08 TRINITY_DN3459_c0_g1_i1:53-1516(+)